jgi:hypothetical protein
MGWPWGRLGKREAPQEPTGVEVVRDAAGIVLAVGRGDWIGAVVLFDPYLTSHRAKAELVGAIARVAWRCAQGWAEAIGRSPHEVVREVLGAIEEAEGGGV